MKIQFPRRDGNVGETSADELLKLVGDLAVQDDSAFLVRHSDGSIASMRCGLCCGGVRKFSCDVLHKEDCVWRRARELFGLKVSP